MALEYFHFCSEFLLFISGPVLAVNDFRDYWDSTNTMITTTQLTVLAWLGTVYKEHLTVQTAHKAEESLWEPSVKISCNKNF